MDIFFHHVGQEGAKEDFKKTIYTKIDITYVEEKLSDDYLQKTELIEMLNSRFPSGQFNCWGVPAGAKSVIKSLKEGDYVFLVESSRIDGAVPVLCPVKLFWPFEIQELSSALWGQAKFPYIFFFETEELNLMWIQFLEDIGYKENFSPRGNFYKVKEERFNSIGGANSYINHILTGYLKNGSLAYNQISAAVKCDNNNTILDEENEIEKLIHMSLGEPSLTEGLSGKDTVISKIPRDTAFGISVKRLYNFKCAICGLSLKSHAGKYEVQAAHIYPKSKDGSDDLRNGVCLCHLHHWALDTGWIAISDDYEILVRDDIPKNEDYKCISTWKGKKISLPKDPKFNPHTIYLRENRKLNGFE